MTRDQLTKALNAFLVDDVLQVTALTGDWGVGKTFFWRNYADSLSLGESFNGISYASVFGADSLEEIRTRITAGVVLSKERDAIMQRYREQAGKLLMPRELPSKARGILELIDRYRRGELTGLASQAGYWFVRDCIVCLDDIERVGKQIDSRALMGIIDELRERNCKVVLLLNRDQLPKEGSDFQKYWEKIVDIDLVLAPDIDTNVSVVFGEIETLAEYRESIASIFKKVDCRNIRIYKRAQGLIESFLSHTVEAPAFICQLLVEHSALLSWAILDSGQELSDQVVSSEQYNSLWVAVLSQGGARDRLSEDEKNWAKVIEKTGFEPLPFDKYLVNYLRTGWLDLDGLAEAISEVEERVVANDSQNQLRDVLRSYGDDFNVDQDQYVNRITNVLTEGLGSLTVFDFDNGLESLSMLDQATDGLANGFVEARGDHLQKVAEAQGRHRQLVNLVLKDEVDRRESEYRANRYTIDQVAQDLSGRDGWSGGQIEFLANQSVDAFVEWILSSPPSLIHKIRAILEFRGQNEGPYPQMVARLEDALRAIAQQSDFNAKRIETAYGVTSPEDGEQESEANGQN